jgi:NAD(P)-dependent dehydrogenase (short-subunit alcohol dehydrogenase family)
MNVDDLDELDRCLDVLESLAADPPRLARVEPERRRRLLSAAAKLKKTLRRKDHLARKAHDAALVQSTEIRRATSAPLYVPPPRRESTPESSGELARARACYVCKEPFTKLHFFYDQLCPPCADLNYAKRFQTASLEGRVAVVTGARVKIGHQVALMMLRAGARVVATTRFPRDAARRFARHADFDAWRDRLEVHGLDLRHSPSVELFARHLTSRLGRLDLLVNNAAQTVRRPPRFYEHLVPLEEGAFEDVPAAARPLLAANDELRASLGGAPSVDVDSGLVRFLGGGEAIGLLAPARLSQLAYRGGEHDDTPELFPRGETDLDLQQVDRRPMNTWRLGAAEVSTPELLEVHLVNAVAPFILTARLAPLMKRDRTDEKHVVHVSAMEASFSRKKKTDKHPHTNMAKASLNMLTRTSAADYAADGIFMNSVDTGWVTDEDPLVHVARKQRVHEFHPPLDVVDGAARVCDPFFSGLLAGDHPWGVFFKDYRPCNW